MKRFILSLALICAEAPGAEPVKLTCEQWHPRLGQTADKVFAIDLDAKTCNGQPCSISDTQFKWQEQNGRYESTVDRRTSEGTFSNLGELIFTYKNCTVPAAK